MIAQHRPFPIRAVPVPALTAPTDHRAQLRLQSIAWALLAGATALALALVLGLGPALRAGGVASSTACWPFTCSEWIPTTATCRRAWWGRSAASAAWAPAPSCRAWRSSWAREDRACCLGWRWICSWSGCRSGCPWLAAPWCSRPCSAGCPLCGRELGPGGAPSGRVPWESPRSREPRRCPWSMSVVAAGVHDATPHLV